MSHITAIYPGTFDPITLGHVNMIERTARLFSRVIVGVAYAYHKKTLFSFEQRREMAEKSCANFHNVQVLGFEGLLTEFAQKQNAQVVVRGLRSGTDWDYEWQLAGMNKSLSPNIETIFLSPDAQYQYISSTLVREIAHIEGSVRVKDFVPACVKNALHDKLGR